MKNSEHCTEMTQVLSDGAAVDQDIVKENQDETAHKWSQNVIH
jgi:hypothetical protein